MALEIRCMRGTNLSCHNNTSHYISGRDITVNVTDNTSQYLFTDRQNYYGGGNESYGYDAGSGENYNNAQNIIGTILNTGEKASTNIGAQRWVRSLVYSNWSAGDPGLGFGAAAQVFANTSNSWVEPPKWVMPNTNAIGYGWNNNTGCAVWDSTPSGTAIGWNQGSVYRVFPPNSGTYQNPSGSSTAVAGARNIGFCNNWFNIHQNVQTNSWFPDGINYIYYCGKKHTLDTNVATASAPTLGNLSAPGLLGNGFPSMCHRRNFIVDNTLPAASGNLITAGTVSHYGNIQGWIRGNAQYNISGGETPSMVASGSRAIYGEAQNIGNANQNPIPSLANKSLYDKNNSNSWDGSNDNEGLYDNLGIIGAYGTYTRQSPIPGCGQLGAGMYSINCWVNTENGQYGEGDLIALRARASDLAGNAQTSPVGYRRVDNSPPAILYAVTGQGLPAPDINSGHYTGMDYSPSFWYTSPVDLHAVTGGLNPYGSGARAVRVCTNSTLQANCTVPTGYTGNDISAANRLTGDLTSAPMGNGFINAPAYTISSPTRVAIRGEDIAGNLSSEISFTAKVDLNNPSVSVSGVPAGWTNAASVPVTATATDSAASINSGINEIHFVGSGTVAGSGTPNIAPGNYVSQYYTPPANGVASSTQNRSFTFTNEGAHRYYVSTYDAASRAEGTGDFWIRIDRSLPTSTITMPVGAVGTIINGSSPVTVAASDQALLAGVNQLRYSVLPGASQNCGSVNWATASNVPVGAPATNVSGSVNPPAGTTSTICVRSTDAAGNVSAVASSNVTVDNSLPTLTVTGDNPGSWSNVDLSVTANANDTITGIASLARNNVSGSGTSQNTGTSNWATSPNTLRTWNGTYSNEQSRIYNFIATDGGGNTASDQVEINIDKTAPTVTAPAQANVLEGVQLTATASDQATLSGAANGRFEFCTLSSKANCDAAPIGSWDTANAWASGPNACTGGNLGTGGGLSGTGAHPNKTYTCTIDSTTPKNASGNVYVRLRARDNAGNEAISTGGSVEVAVPTTVCKLIYYKD
jgi:hypothetical protein